LNEKLKISDEEFPLISVIVTARNEEKMIESCIYSIFEQNYPNFEIIYVDAESTDKTYEIVSNLENKIEVFTKCKKFVCVKKNADSPGKGRNIGVKLSKGKFIAFTDADCIVSKNWLQELITYLKKGNNVVGGPNIIKHFKFSKVTNAIDKVLGTFLGSSGAPQFLKIEKITEVYGIPACNLSLTRKTFDKLNGFNEELRYNEDTDLCYRLTEEGCKIIYNPKAIVDHYMGLDSFKEFLKFVYNYGVGRGKNVLKNKKLFSYLHLIALSTIFSIISLSFLSIFFKESILPLKILVLICFSIIGGNSIFLCIKNKSISIFPLSFFILISEHITYNVGFMKGIIYAQRN
jgi:GT2 family glycosyltransferase